MPRSTIRDSLAIAQLSTQWKNPSDVLSVLLLIGGDIVQKALAQTSGGLLTPVCFSFGWVAYSLMALVGLIGDGRLLPTPDYPTKVINLDSGYSRENRNWIVGRILRDNEIKLSQTHPQHNNAIRIAVYVAVSGGQSPSRAGTGVVAFVGLVIIALQFFLAAVPVFLDREWEILLITGIGTLLVQTTAALPQWHAEKLPLKQRCDKNIALTSGNGSRDIMVVLGCGNAIDLEAMASSETPRSSRVWEKVGWLSRPVMKNRQPTEHPNGMPMRQAYTFRGIPYGFWLTLFTVSVQSITWLALLISVAGMKSHTWYLLGVGLLGMFQNAIVAGISRGPEKRSLPLKLAEVIQTNTVMDGLMDLEVTFPTLGRPLLEEFFPGRIRKNETEWWNSCENLQNQSNSVTEYDKERIAKGRTPPRSYMPRYVNSRLEALSTFSPNQYRKTSSFGSTVSAPVAVTPLAQVLDSRSARRPSESGSQFQQRPKKATFEEPQQEKAKFSSAADHRLESRPPSSKMPSDLISTHDFEPESYNTPTQTIYNIDRVNRGQTLSIDDVYSIARSPSWA